MKVKKEIERLLEVGFIRPTKYTGWMENIVPVVKKNDKIRVCIDFRDLCTATPKDVYVMPVSDMLIDAIVNHEMLIRWVCFASYDQIIITKEDIHKMTLRCLEPTGTFEWVMMPFGLWNAGATYQHSMNLIFHDVIGKSIKAYIDDVVAKCKRKKDHVAHLRQRFERLMRH